jgi:hypothetical protein
MFSQKIIKAFEGAVDECVGFLCHDHPKYKQMIKTLVFCGCWVTKHGDSSARVNGLAIDYLYTCTGMPFPAFGQHGTVQCVGEHDLLFVESENDLRMNCRVDL